MQFDLDIQRLSKKKFSHAVLLALLFSVVVISFTAILARATLNLQSALSEDGNPDLALHLLLPEETIQKTTVLREETDEMHYLIQTKEGQKFVKIWVVDGEWTLAEVESLR